MTPEYHYRYEDLVYSTCSISVSGGETYGVTEPVIKLFKFKTLKETPKGYWIEGKVWVSSTSRKRYAYPSPDLAWWSFSRA